MNKMAPVRILDFSLLRIMEELRMITHTVLTAAVIIIIIIIIIIFLLFLP
jgi:hypothetical protein